MNEQLRQELQDWFRACLRAQIEPVHIFEMLLSESKNLKDSALDQYEKSSEIHDFMLGNLSPNDAEFRTPF
jgi:hypothetical protein